MKPVLPFLFLILLPLSGQELDLRAHNTSFPFVDQKKGIGNSCGPACLLNAFGSGSQPWQEASARIPGNSDRARIASVIKSFGQSPSQTLPNRNRWELKGGVNFTDLATMADEMRQLKWGLPRMKSQLYFAQGNKESSRQLALAHKHLRQSLQKGFPPILSVRRFVRRNQQWQSVHGHFVVLTALPEKVAKGSASFPVQFVDPSGARTFQGTIQIADPAAPLPCLVLDSPNNSMGKKSVRKGEANAIGLSGAIGAW